MKKHPSGLTDKEFDDFNKITGYTIYELITCADKHNIDRDSFIKFFSQMFSAMVEISTFTNFGTEENENNRKETS